MGLVEVSMVREDLKGLPRFPLKPGFSLRFHQPGDDVVWTRVQQEAEHYHTITPDLFWKCFGEGEAELPRRQIFLCNADGREIGTATAWDNDDYHGLRWGRVHWVAISEDYQGQGLGRALVSAVCQRFVELGHVRAYLTTESVRLPAISLYRSFGFVPEIKNDADRREWERVRAQGVDVGIPGIGGKGAA